MKILVIYDHVPMPDRASGELRLYTLLKLMAQFNNVVFCPFDLEGQKKVVGEKATHNYIEKLKNINIILGSTDLISALKVEQFDVVIFEFYHGVNRFINFVRYLQPNATVFIDSVDVHYKRYFSKATLTGKPSDFEYAKLIQEQELAAYQKADLIIVVTEDDAKLLKKDAQNSKIGILSNIHMIPEYNLPSPPRNRLLFVGAFAHEPNVDAVLYFCEEIFPLLLSMDSNFTLEVIGPKPPKSVLALHSEKINIRGFVENLEKSYRDAHISIAPLRFGGGIKGKVGEALSFGLPVVTTEIGAEGFGLTPGENILIADTAQEFAETIMRLSNDNELYRTISQNGYHFINDNYSEESTKVKVAELIDRAISVPKKSFTFWSKILFLVFYPYHYFIYIKPRLVYLYDIYIGWRLKAYRAG